MLIVASVVYTALLLTKEPVSINLDGAMYMEGAIRLLEGGLPYIDFVDINPPLVYYLHIPPVMLSEFTGLAPTNVFLALLILVTLLSAMVSFRLLTRIGDSDVTTAALVSLTPALLLIPLQPNFDLGQRAHLFMLAVLPWLILRLLRYQGHTPNRLTATTIGLCTGLAVCLKPFHYGTILVIAEAFLLLRHWRPMVLITSETISTVSIAALYGLSFLFMAEASSAAFFDLYLPLILNSYQAYAATTVVLFSKAGEYLTEPLILALACAALCRADPNPFIRNLSSLAALTALTGTLLFLLQGKGWAYHAIPVWFGGYLAATCLISKLLHQYQENLLSRFVRSAPLLLMFALILLAITYATKDAANDGKKKVRDYVSDVIRTYSDDGETIYVMSTSVDAAYPLLLQVNRRQATRYPFLFPLAMMYYDAETDLESAYQNRIPAERAEMERDFLSTLNADLVRANPPLILIERWSPCVFCPEEMTLPAYVNAHTAELSAFNNYEHAGWTKRFEILLRKDVLAEKGAPQ